MVRRAALLLIGWTLVLLATRAGAAEPALTSAQYAQLMDRLAERVERAAFALARRRFTSRMEAAAALAELTPARFGGTAAVLAELHVTGTQVAAFTSAHPDEVEAAATRFQARLAPAIEAAGRALQAQFGSDEAGQPVGDVARAGAAERPMTDAEYARFVQVVGNRLETALRAAQPGDGNGLILGMALPALLSGKFHGPVAADALQELHLSERQLDGYLKAHPDAARVGTGRIWERIDPILSAKAATLPKPPPAPRRPPTIDVDDAIRAAAQRHRPLLLFYSAEWCLPCKELKPALADARVQTLADVALVDVSSDEDPRARAASQRFRVETLPLLVLVRDGNERLRIDHSVRAEELVTALTRALR